MTPSGRLISRWAAFPMNAATWFQHRVEACFPRWGLVVIGVGAIAWVPAQLVGVFVSTLMPGPEAPVSVDATVTDAVFLGLIVAPVLETQLMRLCLVVLKKSVWTSNAACLITAAVFVLLHNPSRSWGLHALWSFWIMGNCYVACERRSVTHAVLITTGVHALFNFLSYTATLLLRYVL